jgi:hypothetical protein
MGRFEPVHFRSKLDQSRLRDRLIAVLQFAVEHLPRIKTYAPHWSDNEGEDVVRVEDKIVAETAILLLVAARAIPRATSGHELILRLTELLESAAADRRALEILLRSPHNAPALGLPQVVLASFRRGDEQIQEVIRRIFSARLADALERIPYRAMEVRWVESIAAPNGRVDMSDLLAMNVLVKRIHPISMSRTTGYALTHGIMYATNFGAEPLTGSLDVDFACARIDAALAWVLVNEDLDLLIEFIIAATLLRQPWSPYVWLAFHLCNNVWDELGFLPCPSFKPSEYVQLQGDAASAYVYRHVYHTMYVAGLLCAILLTSDCDPAETWESPKISTSEVAEACSKAALKARKFSGSYDDGIGQKPPVNGVSPEAALSHVSQLISEMIPDHLQWRKALADVDMEPCVIARVLGDAAIIHAARLYDLPKLLSALNTVMALEGPPSLTAIEGALFVANQQMRDGCIGVQFLAPEARRSAAALEATAVIGGFLGQYAARFGDCLADGFKMPETASFARGSVSG